MGPGLLNIMDSQHRIMTGDARTRSMQASVTSTILDVASTVLALSDVAPFSLALTSSAEIRSGSKAPRVNGGF
jgi:hypothetical protein